MDEEWQIQEKNGGSEIFTNKPPANLPFVIDEKESDKELEDNEKNKIKDDNFSKEKNNDRISITSEQDNKKVEPTSDDIKKKLNELLRGKSSF